MSMHVCSVCICLSLCACVCSMHACEACVYVVQDVCGYVHQWAHVLRSKEATGTDILFCHWPSCSLRRTLRWTSCPNSVHLVPLKRCFIKPRARLADSKPNQFSCLDLHSLGAAGTHGLVLLFTWTLGDLNWGSLVCIQLLSISLALICNFYSLSTFSMMTTCTLVSYWLLHSQVSTIFLNIREFHILLLPACLPP